MLNHRSVNVSILIFVLMCHSLFITAINILRFFTLIFWLLSADGGLINLDEIIDKSRWQMAIKE